MAGSHLKGARVQLLLPVCTNRGPFVTSDNSFAAAGNVCNQVLITIAVIMPNQSSGSLWTDVHENQMI